MKALTWLLTFIFLLSVVSAQCTDTDEGKNKYEIGTVTDGDETFEDSCNEKNINEYFCTVEGAAAYSTLPCVNGCSNGECQLANQIPPIPAPEEEDKTNIKLYFYGIIILGLIGLYVYLFKIKKKKKRY